MSYAIMEINRVVSQTEYFMSGNTPEMIIQTPESWTVDQVERFQNIFDQSAGNLAKRRRVKFVPHSGAAPFETKGAMLKDDFDEWLARIFCAAINVPATPFIRQLNRSTAQTSADTSREEGTMGDLEWLQNLITRLVVEGLKIEGVSAYFDLDSDPDPLKQAQINDIGIKNGTKQIDEVREDNGDDSIGLPPGLVTAQGFVPFEASIAAAQANAQNALNPPAPGQKQLGSGSSSEEPSGEKVQEAIKLLSAGNGHQHLHRGISPALRKKKVLTAY